MSPYLCLLIFPWYDEAPHVTVLCFRVDLLTFCLLSRLSSLKALSESQERSKRLRWPSDQVMRTWVQRARKLSIN